MPEQLKAFVSSTCRDLAEHRQRVIEALRRAGVQVDPMEAWPAAPGHPAAVSQDRVAGCDFMILLVARTRGYRPDPGGESITQMEYRAARAAGVEVFPFLLADTSNWNGEDQRDRDPALLEWREELKKSHVVSFFEGDAQRLGLEVLSAVTRWVHDACRLAPATFLAACRQQMEEAVERLSGHDRYRPEAYVTRDVDAYLWRFLEAEQSHVFPLIGSPGTGKTSAACNLARSMMARQWPGVLLDTSEFHLRGREKSTLDAILAGALNVRLPAGAPLFDERQVLDSLNRLMLGRFPGKCFAVIIDGLDEVRSVSQLGGYGFPVSADALADLLRSARNYPRLKFVVTCRTSPWGDIMETGSMRSVGSTLPKRHDEEVEIKEIASGPGRGPKGPEVCTLETFNDVELSLAVAKYQQHHGIRVHLGGSAWEDARDPFMLGAAFGHWGGERPAGAGRFHYLEASSPLPPDGRLPPWTIVDLGYLDKLDHYWQQRIERIADVACSYNVDRGWRPQQVRRWIAGLTGRLVELMLRKGQGSVALARLLRGFHGPADLAEMLVRWMCEGELLRIEEHPDDPQGDAVQFYTHRLMEYQLGRKILQVMLQDDAEAVQGLVASLKAHADLLRQPFQLAMRELCRGSHELSAEKRQVMVDLLLGQGVEDLALLGQLVDQLPFLPEADRADVSERLLWRFANCIWSLERTLATLRVPDELAALGQGLAGAAERLKAPGGPSGSQPALREELLRRSEETCAAVRRLYEVLDSPARAQLLARVSPSFREYGAREAAEIRAAYQVFSRREVEACLGDLAERLESLAGAVARALPRTADAGGSGPGSPPEQHLREACHELLRLYEELSSRVDLLYLAGRLSVREPAPDDLPAAQLGDLPQARLADYQEVASLAYGWFSRPEPEVRAFAESLIGLLHRQSGVDVADRARDLHDRGNERYKQGDFEGARRLYDLALSLDPNLLETWFNRGLAMIRLNRYRDGCSSLDEAIARFSPGNKAVAEAHYTKGLACEYLADFAAALACYDQALAADAEYQKARTQREVALGKQRALQQSQQASDEPCDPQSPEWSHREARRLEARCDYAAAERLYREAFARLVACGRRMSLQWARDWAWCLMQTASSLLAIEAYLTARDQAIAAGLRRGEFSDVLNNLGCLYADREQYAAGEFYYLAALAAEPDDAVAACNLADQLAGPSVPEDRVDLEAASREAERLRQLGQQPCRALNVLAQVAWQRNGRRPSDAWIALLDEAAAADHYDAVWACADLAGHYRGEGETEAARYYAGRALALLPAQQPDAQARLTTASLCAWCFCAAQCAALLGDRRALDECRGTIEEIVCGNGPGPHLPSELRVFSPVAQSSVAVPLFLEQLRALAPADPPCPERLS